MSGALCAIAVARVCRVENTDHRAVLRRVSARAFAVCVSEAFDYCRRHTSLISYQLFRLSFDLRFSLMPPSSPRYTFFRAYAADDFDAARYDFAMRSPPDDDAAPPRPPLFLSDAATLFDYCFSTPMPPPPR